MTQFGRDPDSISGGDKYRSFFLHFRGVYARARRLAPFRIVLRAYAAIAFIRLRTFLILLEYT